MTKRMFALLLGMLLLVCPLMAACNNTATTESTPDASQGGNTTSSGTTSGETSEDSIYLDDNGMYTVENLGIPAFNFSKDTFVVCVTSNVGDTTYFSEEIAPDLYDTTDSVLNEAVRARNDLIFEQYGVQKPFTLPTCTDSILK